MTKTREFENFDQAIKTILRADPKVVKEAMEAQKLANTKKRKAKQRSSSSDREASDKG